MARSESSSDWRSSGRRRSGRRERRWSPARRSWRISGRRCPSCRPTWPTARYGGHAREKTRRSIPRTVRKEKHRLCASPSWRMWFMDHCRIKIPRILPEIFPSGGQQQYTAACPRLKTKTKHLKKKTAMGDEIFSLCDLSCESADRDRKW